MRRLICFAAATLLLAGPAMAENPVVVELFQSQGCSSCLPANANLIAIADRPGVLALSWEVTYWDYLGWKDVFGDRVFTDRQWAYSKGLGNRNVYTPQIIVNGRTELVGDNAAELDAAITHAAKAEPAPSLSLSNTGVSIGAATTPAYGDVFLVRYDPNLIQVPIQHGENAGRTLPHRNVVRQFIRLGVWQGRRQDFSLPPAPRAGLKTAILVQSGPGGPILAATHS